jgi:hypothetical protein
MDLSRQPQKLPQFPSQLFKMIFPFHLLHAVRAKAIGEADYQMITLFMCQFYLLTLTLTDGTNLAFKECLASGARFFFVFCHGNK